MTTTTETRALTPVKITASYPTHASGQIEPWEAVSEDGLWAYHRLEIAGTPWETEHVPSGRPAGCWQLTLDDARAATADGTALAALESAPTSPGCQSRLPVIPIEGTQHDHTSAHS